MLSLECIEDVYDLNPGASPALFFFYFITKAVPIQSLSGYSFKVKFGYTFRLIFWGGFSFDSKNGMELLLTGSLVAPRSRAGQARKRYGFIF